MCFPKAALSSLGWSHHFSVDSVPVSDTLVLSSRFGNMLVLKLLVVLGTWLFLSYCCIVGNTLVPELSVIGTCLF